MTAVLRAPNVGDLTIRLARMKPRTASGLTMLSKRAIPESSSTQKQIASAEYICVISKWTFHPVMCVYQSATQEMDFDVTFKGY